MLFCASNPMQITLNVNIYAALESSQETLEVSRYADIDCTLPLNLSLQAMGMFGNRMDAPKLTMRSQGYISSQMTGKQGCTRAQTS